MDRTRALLDLYGEKTRTGRFDDYSDELRKAIEDEIKTKDHQAIRNDFQAQTLQPQIARVLKDEGKRDWADRRRGARGVKG